MAHTLIATLFQDPQHVMYETATPTSVGRLETLINRMSYPSDLEEREVRIRWQSSNHPLDEGPNFDRVHFFALLDYYQEKRVITMKPTSETFLRRTSGNHVRQTFVERREGADIIEGVSDERFVVSPSDTITMFGGRHSILSKFEFACSIKLMAKTPGDGPIPSREAVPLFLVHRLSFPFTDRWSIEAETIQQFPNGGDHVNHLRKLLPRSEDMKSTTGICQYRLDVVASCDGRDDLFRSMEAPLLAAIESGVKGVSKRREYRLANHLSFLWKCHLPFIRSFDKGYATRLEETFNRGELLLHHLLSPMRTASADNLVRLYGSLDEQPYYFTHKLDGAVAKVIIILSPIDGGSTFKLEVIEGMVIEGIRRHTTINQGLTKELKWLGMPPSNTTYTIFDAEKVGDTFYLFRTVALCNRSFIGETEKTSWEAISSPFVNKLIEFVNGSNIIHLDRNEPTLLTKTNFNVLLDALQPTHRDLAIDGGILTAVNTLYFPSKMIGTSGRYKLKPRSRCAIDMLLRAINPATLAAYNIVVPPSTKSVYIGYVGASSNVLKNSPRPPLRRGLWRNQHFPSLVRDRRTTYPAAFLTSILPHSHVIVSTEEGNTLDDCIAECIWREGWFTPTIYREDKTTEYRMGTGGYGNSYIGAMGILPAILDPITPEIITDIEKASSRYFDPDQSALRPFYRAFTDACAIGKALLYGKMLKPAITPGPLGVMKAVIEIGGGRGSDLPRLYCAGGRQIYVIDPDVHALFTYDQRANHLNRYYGSDTASIQRRNRLGEASPIIFPTTDYRIEGTSNLSLRCIIGEMGDETLQTLQHDLEYPHGGVMGISIQFAIHYMDQDVLLRFIDSTLAPGGRVIISHYDGPTIQALLDATDAIVPWQRKGNGIELHFAEGERAGMMKYRIERRESGKMAVFLPTISPTLREETMVHPTFPTDRYTTIYDGAMIDEVNFATMVRNNTRPTEMQLYYESLGSSTSTRDLCDCFSAADLAYLRLIRFLVVERVKPTKKKARPSFGSSL